MRKILFVLLLSVPLVSSAQIYFKMDAGLGGAFTFGDLKSYGIMAHAEPKVFILPSLSAGLRIEGDALFGGTITEEASDLSVGVSSRAAILLKGEYYFTDNKTRPFLGLGVGSYTIANTSATGEGSASIGAGNHFGVAPELGVTFGNFRLSAMYHILTGSSLVDMSAGAPKEISMNYLVIQLGFKVFQVGGK
jgi:outer membrane protein X